jgi:hypothetical protein
VQADCPAQSQVPLNFSTQLAAFSAVVYEWSSTVPSTLSIGRLTVYFASAVVARPSVSSIANRSFVIGGLPYLRVRWLREVAGYMDVLDIPR